MSSPPPFGIQPPHNLVHSYSFPMPYHFACVSETLLVVHLQKHDILSNGHVCIFLCHSYPLLWDSPRECILPFYLHIWSCIHTSIPPSCSIWKYYLPLREMILLMKYGPVLCIITLTSSRNWHFLSLGWSAFMLPMADLKVCDIFILVSMPAGASIWTPLTLNWESHSLIAILADPFRVAGPRRCWETANDSQDLLKVISIAYPEMLVHQMPKR